MIERVLLTKDDTYTVSGNFDSQQISLWANIPESQKNNFYDFIDISKGDGNSKLNAILIYMEDGVNVSLDYKNTPPVKLPGITKANLKRHPDSTGFDWDDTNRALVILFHEDESNNKDIDSFFKAVEVIYDIHKYTGNFNVDWKEIIFNSYHNKSRFDDKLDKLLHDLITILGKPRRAGMSVIVKV